MIADEENITLFANCRAIKVEMKGEKIDAVVIKHIETGEEQILSAPLFSDCTGDGTIGYLAGADYRMGREARAEYGEDLAPEKADKMTMEHLYSGILLKPARKAVSQGSIMELLLMRITARK
mgnify:CR=1 FL=1